MITFTIVIVSVALYLYLGYRFMVWDVRQANADLVKQYFFLYLLFWWVLWPISWIQDHDFGPSPITRFVDWIELNK